MITVTLNRDKDTGKESLGSWSFDYGDVNMTCKTLEKPWKGNQQNISCIPKGAYIVKWTFSPKFMRYTYEVQNVPNRSGIRIHPGSFFWDIVGCIILGSSYRDINGDGETDILDTRVVVSNFEQMMEKKDFQLIIK